MTQLTLLLQNALQLLLALPRLSSLWESAPRRAKRGSNAPAGPAARGPACQTPGLPKNRVSRAQEAVVKLQARLALSIGLRRPVLGTLSLWELRLSIASSK